MKPAFYKIFVAIGFLALTITSCTKEYDSIEQIDDRNIQAYIKQNNISGVQQFGTTGMYYQIISPGQGTPMEYSEKVPLVYTFKTLDNAYSSTDTIANHYGNFLGYFSLEGVRTGIKEILIKRGGQIRLLVPSKSAYGRNGLGDIPGNTSIDVTVKALDIAGLPAYEDIMINKYMQANSLSGFSKTNKGIYYKISNPGSGSGITVDSILTTSYTGKLLNGTVFDTSTSFITQLANVIPAWQQILMLVKKGGVVRFITPSAQAYGLTGSAIPGFSPLDFEVTVINVSKGN